MSSLLRFLKQPSTWKGLTWMLTLLGVALSPEQREAIGVAGVVMNNELERLKKENIALREALRPFAEWSNRITNQDIERAKALLETSADSKVQK